MRKLTFKGGKARDSRSLRPISIAGIVMIVMACVLGLTWPGGIGDAQAAEPVRSLYYDANGFNPQQEYFDQKPHEAIDTFTGCVTWCYNDIFLPGNGGFDLKLNRVYNSKIFTDLDGTTRLRKPLGHAGVGWKMHMGVLWVPGVQTPANDSERPYIEMSDGSEHILYSPTATYTNLGFNYITRDFWKVTTIPTGGYELTLKNGTKYQFTQLVTEGTTKGYWCTKVMDTHGNQVTVAYKTTDPRTRIDTITQTCTPQNRVLTFNYNSANMIQSVSGNGKTLFSYGYETGTAVGGETPYRLITATPPAGAAWRYTYYGSGDGNGDPNELAAVKYPTDAVAPTITYRYQDGTIKLMNGGTRTVRRIRERETTEGRWTYTFEYADTGDVTSKTTVVSPSASTGYASALKEQYFYDSNKAGTNGNVWKVGLLKKKETYWNDVLMQKEERSWSTKTVSGDSMGVPPETGTDSSLTRAAILTAENITRYKNATQYATYSNSFPAADYDIYGNAKRHSESGQVSRSTAFGFDYKTDNGRYIVDRITSETLSDADETYSVSRVFNDLGDMTSENRLGASTTYTYYIDGNLKSARDANNNTTSYSNYAYGMPQTINRAGLSTLNQVINWSGTMSSKDDGRGNTTSFAYDNLNRVTTINLPGNDKDVTVSYGDNYRTATQYGGAGTYYLRVNLDEFGRIYSTLDSVGVQTRIGYDNLGRKSYNSYPYTTTNKGDSFECDAIGRVTKITHADGKSISRSYDDQVHQASETNERLKTTTSQLKAYGNPDETFTSRITDARLKATGYDYNLLGKIKSVDPPLGENHLFKYENAAKPALLTSETHPETGMISYTYDNAGNVKTRIWGGKTATYNYDALNRLKSISYSGTDSKYNVSFAYDAADNLVRMADIANPFTYSYDYAYDENSRLSAQKTTIAGHTYYSRYYYDDRGNLEKAVCPGSSRPVNYHYDNANRVSSIDSVVGGGAMYLSQVNERHPSGGITKALLLGNNTNWERSYDANRYWPTSVKYYYGSNYYLNETAISRDEVGNPTGITHTTDGFTSVSGITYDELDRLKTATGKWGTASYEYDDLGNRTRKTYGSATTNYTYNTGSGGNNRLESATGSEAASYSYDSCGNVTGNGSHSFVYTVENRIENADSGRFTYNYDGAGKLVMKEDSQGPDYIYLYDSKGQLVSEVEKGTTSQNDYVFMDGEPLAVVKGQSKPTPNPVIIAPNSGAASANINVTITGTGFASGSQVVLRKAGQASIEATGEIVTGTTQIKCTLPILNKASGAWHVVVVNTDGTEGFICDGFTIMQTSPCGTGTGATVVVIGGILGLMSLAGARRRKIWLADLRKKWGRRIVSVLLIAAVAALVILGQAFVPVTALRKGSTASAQTTVEENAYWFINDDMGTPCALTDEQRNVVWQAHFRPFGELKTGDITATIANRIGYSGKLMDESIGLVEFGARHYDPKTGRFTSTDPIFHIEQSPQDMNLYSYASNCPYRMVDTDGRGVTDRVNAYVKAYSQMNWVAQVAIGAGLVAGLTLGTVAVAVGGAYTVGVCVGASLPMISYYALHNLATGTALMLPSGVGNGFSPVSILKGGAHVADALESMGMSWNASTGIGLVLSTGTIAKRSFDTLNKTIGAGGLNLSSLKVDYQVRYYSSKDSSCRFGDDGVIDCNFTYIQVMEVDVTCSKTGWGSIKSGFESAWGGIKSGLSSGWGKLSGWGRSAWGTLGGWGRSAWGTLGGWGRSIGGFFGGLF